MFVIEVVINSDGCIDVFFIECGLFKQGIYELIFYVVDYFKGFVVVVDLFFFDVVMLCFIVGDISGYYYVLFVMMFWFYSIYWGS